MSTDSAFRQMAEKAATGWIDLYWLSSREIAEKELIAAIETALAAAVLLSTQCQCARRWQRGEAGEHCRTCGYFILPSKENGE